MHSFDGAKIICSDFYVLPWSFQFAQIWIEQSYICSNLNEAVVADRMHCQRGPNQVDSTFILSKGSANSEYTPHLVTSGLNMPPVGGALPLHVNREQEHNLPPLARAENAAPWRGQWCYIYDVIALSEPWHYLLFFEDLFARTFAKFSVNCRLLNLPDTTPRGPVHSCSW